MRHPLTNVLVIAISIASLFAQSTAAERSQNSIEASWKERLTKAHDLLLLGDWKKARRASDRLIKDVYTQIRRGEDARYHIAVATLQRGIAEVGLDRSRAGLWDIDVATYLDPRLATADYSVYGTAGERIRAIKSEILSRGPGEVPNPHTERPTIKTELRPEQAFLAYATCLAGNVSIRVLVDQHGHPTEPLVVFAAHPFLAFSVLEGARDLVFEPATLEGHTVPAYHNIGLNLSLPSCSSR